MIQVCSTCGTRWNVRDRRRDWCPRCNGTLMAPSGPDAATQYRPAGLGTPPSGKGGSAAGRTPPRLPPGYRWIAVRPGAAPPPRRGRRPLGPTPRYAFIPRWGLVDRFDQTDQQEIQTRSGPSARTVRATLIATMAVFGVAAFLHLVRYGLLIINRGMLLNPWVAGGATWLGVGASVLAIFTLVASAVVLTNWLIARRETAYARSGVADPRSGWEILVGCLVPLANLLLAPLYVFELARAENRLSTLRRDIVVWWCVWVLSTALMVWSVATSFTRDTQGIADNTVTTIIAYLAGLAALILASRVFSGFEATPVDRPTRRWVMVPEEQSEASVEPVETRQREPAA